MSRTHSAFASPSGAVPSGAVPSGAVIVQSQDPFAPLSDFSEESRAWMTRYQREPYTGITRQAEKAVILLRRKDIEAGRRTLREIARGLGELRRVEASIFHVLERWYYSALAYLHYLEAEHELAHQRLLEAHDAIRAAIEEEPFLVVIANHCYDFQLQRARVARNAHHWKEMGRHIELGRAMLENRAPLCVLEEGGPVYIAALDELYATVARQRGVEVSEVQSLADPEQRRRTYEQFVRSMHALPDWIIPYR